LKNHPSVYLETVVLNAGLGFYTNGKAATLAEGFAMARACIASGTAYDKLQMLIRQSNSH
jgi:anthranilate phosphoribosyltransferase